MLELINSEKLEDTQNPHIKISCTPTTNKEQPENQGFLE
jgi:hypothetical protein